MDTFQPAIFRRPHVSVAAKADVHCLIHLTDFPGIAVFQPAVRQFYLLVIDDALGKQAVARQLQGGQRVDEAGSQTAQAAVAQARIPFLGDDVLHIETQICQAFPAHVVHVDAQKVGF